jgi:methionyl-tRNA synthetase
MTQINKPNKFYVTTPIYYINDRPHVGHAYSTIAADTLARYWRKELGEENVMFSTGIDENSKKTIEAAELVDKSIVDYTDEMAAVWKNTWDALGLSYDDFIRTSEVRHKAAVEDMLTKIEQADDISKGYYEGPYCYRCEQFYRDDELMDGNCPVHKKPIEVVKEENYFFDLPKYAKRVKDVIMSGEMEILPQSRRNEVLAFIDRGLEKISISRANQDIGLELPFDRSQKIYVWVEALINYLTVAGYPDKDYGQWWESVTHIVGKDIIKFHCIIWPAMLMSAGLQLPKRVFAHGFFTLDGEKISKSTGNTIDPVDLSNQYGNDALRYYLLREIPFGSDGDFSQARFKVIYDSELSNGLGNLVQRVAVMTSKYCDGQYSLGDLPVRRKVDEALTSCAFDRALEAIFDVVRSSNQKIEESKPWEMAKTDLGSTAELLSSLITEILWVASVLEPFLPETAAKIQATFRDGKVDASIGILFPRVD